jgi:O-methyltransferase
LYNKIKIKFSLIILDIYYLFKLNKKEKKIVNICNNYSFQTTQINILRNNIDILNTIKKKRTQGDFVECGVYKGISLVFFQKYIEINNLENIKIYGFDTFEGIPEPSNDDIDIHGLSMKDTFEKYKINKESSNWNNSSLDEVRLNFKDNTSYNNNLILIKGLVEETLLKKDNLPDKISLLKLDTSLYEGTKIELEVLFPKIQKGGIIIVEGYFKFLGVKKAVDNFFSTKNYLIKYKKTLGRAIIYL